jgi:hypothetical protein
MNNECPRDEWSEDMNGRPRGPWSKQRVGYFFDPETMEKYTWVTGTVGGEICINELSDRVRMMRRYRGERVFAVVRLTHRYMNTRFGGRQRPDLHIVRWVSLDDGGNGLPASNAPQISGPEVKPAPDPAQPAPKKDPISSGPRGKTTANKRRAVEPVTPGEEMDDSIPY